MKAKYIKILCEGTSEEQFVKIVLAPYLENADIYVTPIVLGGVSHYARIRRDIKLLGKDTSSYLTTMLDYYKLPQDVPGVRECKETEPCRIAEYIEAAIKDDLENELSCMGFIPNIIMHEYEALLFSDVDCFQNCIGMTKDQISQLRKEVSQFTSPEHVNNSEQTSPSKRILRIYDAYQKVVDGTMVAESIGIQKMMEKCEHFSFWIRTLEKI